GDERSGRRDVASPRRPHDNAAPCVDESRPERGGDVADPKTDSDELRDLVCLTLVSGVGPHTSRALLEQFGNASRVLRASLASLREVQGVGPKLAERIAKAREEHDPQGEMELCKQEGVRIVPQDDPGYPLPLKRIHDPPPLLYQRGTYESADQ